VLGAPDEGTRVECWLPLSVEDAHPAFPAPDGDPVGPSGVVLGLGLGPLGGLGVGGTG
jgi:hypothetical protein